MEPSLPVVSTLTLPLASASLIVSIHIKHSSATSETRLFHMVVALCSPLTGRALHITLVGQCCSIILRCSCSIFLTIIQPKFGVQSVTLFLLSHRFLRFCSHRSLLHLSMTTGVCLMINDGQQASYCSCISGVNVDACTLRGAIANTVV